MISYYNLCTGNFAPRSAAFGKYYMIGPDNEALYADIAQNTHKLICANDNIDRIDFEKEQSQLVAAFQRVLPEKSAFEK